MLGGAVAEHVDRRQHRLDQLLGRQVAQVAHQGTHGDVDGPRAQDDLATAQFLETRCGSTSGFAHSKTEYEGGVSTGESEQKMPLITAQYVMFDMPEEEIIVFWGKRPFLAKRIAREPENEKPAEALVFPTLASRVPDTVVSQIAPAPSWRTFKFK